MNTWRNQLLHAISNCEGSWQPQHFLRSLGYLFLFVNDDESYQMHLFVYLQISCFALTDFILHSCIRKENTRKNSQSGREVCAYSSEALNDEYRKWHPMKIMVTDPQVRSFEGR